MECESRDSPSQLVVDELQTCPKYNASGDSNYIVDNWQQLANTFTRRSSFTGSQQLLSNLPCDENKVQSLFIKLKGKWKAIMDNMKIADQKGATTVNQVPSKLSVINDSLKKLVDACTPLIHECEQLIQERDEAIFQLKQSHLETEKLYRKIEYLQHLYKEVSGKELGKFSGTNTNINRNSVEIEEILKRVEEDSEICFLRKENDYLRNGNKELNKALMTLSIEKGKEFVKRDNQNNERLNCNCAKIALALKEEKNDNARLQAYIEHVLLKIIKFNPQILEINSYD